MSEQERYESGVIPHDIYFSPELLSLDALAEVVKDNSES